MLYENYLACGFIHKPTKEDPRRGVPEVVLYNPTSESCEATFTVYFSDRESVILPVVKVEPDTNELIVMPDIAPGVLTDAGYCGCKVISTTPLFLNQITGIRIQQSTPMYRGGCTNFHGTKLHHKWRFPHGLWLDWNKYYRADLSKTPFPYNELENYHFLNPYTHDVEMDIILQYQQHPHVTLHFTLKAERVFVWNNFGQVENVHNYCLRVSAKEPISTAAIRYVYGLNGLDEWGYCPHCSMYGIPE